jgi:ATP-binding cassette, subfamily B, bacterial MsbA
LTSTPYQNFSRLATYYKPQLRTIAWGLLFLILAAATEPLIPAMMKELLDYTGQHSGNPLGAKIWPWWLPPVVVLVIFTARASFVFLANLGLGIAVQKVLEDLQNDLFLHFLHSDLKLIQTESSSSLTNAIRTETALAATSFLAVVQDGGRNLLTALALLSWLFWMNWQLTGLTLLLLPMVALVVRKIGQRLRKIAQAQIEAANALNYVIEENTQAHRVVRVFGAQAQQQARFAQVLSHVRGQQVRSLVASSAMTPLTQITAALALAVILSIALQQNQAGQLSVGGFAAYITALLMLISPLKSLGDVYPALQRGHVALERVFSILDHPVEPQGGDFAPAQATGLIEFKGICKQYAGSDHPALHQLSLRIEPRQMVALVGTSGSGKTSLANLLPRFVLQDSGTVAVDGVDVTAWQLTALRKQMALVSQDTVLLNDTVLANVSFGDDRPDRDRAERALKDAHLWAHVQNLPQGLDTPIGHNGQSLSGGQRQRLAIARALYKASPILILDEATSALDSESEHQVQAAILGLLNRCTTLVIAHRLSTVRHANNIVVMNHGQIVEQGTYAELIAQQGAFARLVQQQLH